MSTPRSTVRKIGRYLRARFLPHPCPVCGGVIAPNADREHANWHYWVSMTAWFASGARTKRPKPPNVKPRPTINQNFKVDGYDAEEVADAVRHVTGRHPLGTRR